MNNEKSKTCCGACQYQNYSTPGEWWWEGCKYESHVVTFCPVCGAHLLPGGEFEPRGEVVGRATLVYPIREGFLSVAGVDITILVETFRGEVLLVRPAEEPL